MDNSEQSKMVGYSVTDYDFSELRHTEHGPDGCVYTPHGIVEVRAYCGKTRFRYIKDGVRWSQSFYNDGSKPVFDTATLVWAIDRFVESRQ